MSALHATMSFIQTGKERVTLATEGEWRGKAEGRYDAGNVDLDVVAAAQADGFLLLNFGPARRGEPHGRECSPVQVRVQGHCQCSG